MAGEEATVVGMAAAAAVVAGAATASRVAEGVASGAGGVAVALQVWVGMESETVLTEGVGRG